MDRRLKEGGQLTVTPLWEGSVGLTGHGLRAPALIHPKRFRFLRLHQAYPCVFAGFLGLALPHQALADTESERFDYHSVRGREAVAQAGGLYEGEALPMHGQAREQAMGHYRDTWSGQSHLLWHGEIGERFRTSLSIDTPGRYEVTLQFTKAPDYGQVTVSWNQQKPVDPIDLYHPSVVPSEEFSLGIFQLKAGSQEIVFELVGHHPKARPFRREGQYLMGLDFIRCQPLSPQKAEPITQANPPSTMETLPRLPWNTVSQLLKRHCVHCHGGEATEGKVDFTIMENVEAYHADADLTRRVAEALHFHEMPPEDEPPLQEEDRRQLTATFYEWLDESLQASRSLPPTLLRRMTRFEFNNAVRDLLDLKGDVFALPEKPIRYSKPYFDPASGRYPDAIQVSNRALGKNQIEQRLLSGVTPYAIDLQAEHGFNNQGEQLSVSPILLESFLKLGRSIVESPEFDTYTRRFDELFTPPEEDGSLSPAERARSLLEPFLERAFRAPPDQDTLERYHGHFVSEFRRTQSFTRSMKSVVAAVLASPRFIYLLEGRAGAAGDRPLDPYELATRLSMFLWSSLPDTSLLARARSGELLNPTILEAEAIRMLEDPKSQALSQNFARQWLRLDQLITAVPDFERFEIYYSRIGCEQWKFGLQTMLEPLLLFESILVEDRSVMLLIDSQYSYRSDEMESWYRDAVPFDGKANRNRFNTFTQTFKKRTLPTRREGGVITTAAALTMTSSPLRTNPISRGAWVATVILNRPPPPPPDAVPEIEADDAAIEAQGLTLRERLIQHQVNPNCVTCHEKIDPLGYALENYDAIGRWRERYQSGLPIDASGRLFGQVEFRDPVGLKDALLDHPEWFIRGFSEHLMAYALGRELGVEDRPAIDRILRKALETRGQFSQIVRAIVMSYPFRHKAPDRDTE